jgi:ornithine cyclodeaminase/alanine dehydrogenase-like protein (mu-crystallin family)
MQLLLLAGDDVRRALSMAESIEAVKGAFAQLSAGLAQVPQRTHLSVPKHNGVALFMPAYLPETDSLAVKVASVFPNNAQTNLPTIHALVVVLDATTGRPTAAIDGTYLTALRTGAASGAATDLLARPDSRQVAIFGAGAQGRTQLQAVCEVRAISKVRVYDQVRAKARQYATEMKQRGGKIPSDIQVAETPTDAAADADIICTATTSSSPVFRDEDLKPGVHINGIGSYTPEMQEVDERTVARAKVVVGSRVACLAEAGDLIIPIRKSLLSAGHIHAELGEIVLGQRPGRQTASEVTFFKSVGNASQDATIARLALLAATEKGLGTTVDL